MARMPGAEWRPIPANFTKNGQESVRGVVVHIMDGSFEGTDSWFRNPQAQASSHFGTSRTGTLRQWVDTADRAWAQAGGNRTWLSVENEGRGGDSLTDAQLDRVAQVLAWAHQTYGVPLQLATSPDGRGLGYHAMGGSAWGGHTSCPGTHVVAQLPQIIDRAKRIVTGSTTQQQEDDMDPIDVWAYKGKKNPQGTGAETHDAYWYLRESKTRLDSLTTQVAALSATVKTLAGQVGKGVDTDTVVAAVQRAIADAVVKVDVDVTGAQTQEA